jgi:hypothetical protein
MSLESDLSFEFLQGDTRDCQFLNQLEIPDYNSIIILPYADDFTPEEADAKTLLTLLNLREIAKKKGNGFSIVS